MGRSKSAIAEMLVEGINFWKKDHKRIIAITAYDMQH